MIAACPPAPLSLRGQREHASGPPEAKESAGANAPATAGPGRAPPPRAACPRCLSARLPFRDIDPNGRLIAETTVRVSADPYFRERMPWRVGTIKLDAGPVIVAHLHGAPVEGPRVKLALNLDKRGSAVMLALPAQETPNMQADPIWREMTSDP